METAIVGILGALMGVLLGKALDRNDERRRWRRDEFAASYVTYVEQFTRLRQILRRLATLPASDTAWISARDDRRSSWEKYNSALIRVELLAPAAVYQAILAVDRELRELSVKSSKHDMTLEEWHRYRQPVDELMRTAVDLIRKELRLGRLPSRAPWVAATPSWSEPVTVPEADGSVTTPGGS